MAQIAEEAGLSRFTVSKILRGDTSVRSRNREKVLALCEKYGFVPNSNAVNLVSGSSRVIGMIVPYITDGFYAELIEFTEKYAARRGMNLVYRSSYNDAGTEEKIIRSFLGLNIAALLIVPVVENPDRRLLRLAAANFPVICLDRTVPGMFCSVLNDNRRFYICSGVGCVIHGNCGAGNACTGDFKGSRLGSCIVPGSVNRHLRRRANLYIVGIIDIVIYACL